MTDGGPMPLTSGHHACSEGSVRDRIVLSTVRLSGVAEVQVASKMAVIGCEELRRNTGGADMAGGPHNRCRRPPA